MVDAPQHDWRYFEAQSRDDDAVWLRELTPQARFGLYEELFELIGGVRSVEGDWQRLERWDWDQKVSLRQRLLTAYTKLDQLRRERTTTHNSG